MASDDVTALSVISMGTLVSAALTFSLVAGEGDRRVVARPDAAAAPSTLTCPATRTDPIVDFAIIRADVRGTDVQVTVGPEHPLGRGDARSQSSVQMRLLRTR